MKTFYTLFVCLYTFLCYGQEFKVFDNGLIYSPNAMNKLSSIVGGKNDEFRKCDLNKSFKSIYQTKGMYFKINKPNRIVLKEELLNNISLEYFIEKYANKEDVNYRLITKKQYINRKDESVIRIKEEPNGNKIDINTSEWDNSFFKNWLYTVSSNDYAEVVYILEDFKSIDVPKEYARMIQYSECMIDTTAQIFLDRALKTGVRYNNDKVSAKKRSNFFKYIDKNFSIPKPKYNHEEDNSNWSQFMDSINKWNISKKEYVKSILSHKQDFKTSLNEAYKEAYEGKNSSDELEMYVADYLSKAKALELKRNRRVYGGCSMDNSPRIHAMNIAQLSAESFNWDIFLRAHLNIMNDRIDRVSDGSWAWAARNTYIKELENLNINILDLILGISFRIENPADGHYYGSINRLGRAISESKDVEKIEHKLRLIISDKHIDDYNRLLIYYLYENLMYHKDKSDDKAEYKKSQVEMIKLLPEYLRPENN